VAKSFKKFRESWEDDEWGDNEPRQSRRKERLKESRRQARRKKQNEKNQRFDEDNS
jgi:hypothetical protein